MVVNNPVLVKPVRVVETQSGEAPKRWLDEIDAYELQDQRAEELSYLPLLGRPGYIVQRWSHVLAGYPRSGKTELLFATVCAWLQEGRSVLYFTEEGRVLWQQRLERQRVPCGGLTLVFGLGELPGNLLARMREGEEEIVIVDTLRNLGILPPDENDNNGIARAVAPWVATAREKGKTLILCHHSRKGGGDHGEAISGGHALFGAVDVAVEVRRDNVPARRILKVHARIIQPPDLLYERKADGQLIALGDPAGVGVEEVARRMLTVLDHQWRKTADVLTLFEEPKPSLEQLRLALRAESQCGRVERDPPINVASAQGKAIRWRLPGEG
ncbi:MAG TPA: AAA family ATPase [Gemmataceae bacterium]|nr:AAA family ATPase [Gemmataceae bacterium]